MAKRTVAAVARLRKTEYTIPTEKLGAARRIALLSDLHNGGDAADEAASLLTLDPPDVIAIAGDLYESPPRNPFADAGAIRLLDRLPRGVPIVYCRGNHDHAPTDGTRAALSRAGAIELDSSSVELSGMLFGGLRSAHYTKKIPDLAFLDCFSAEDAGKFKILLSHHPEYYPSYIRQRLGIDLTLSGHAHGGQWCVFGRGIFAPGQGLLPKYTHGLYDGGRLAVSRGMHNSIGIPRILCPTELVYLTIG